MLYIFYLSFIPQLLYSATVSEQLFDDQKDSLLGLFEASALNGQMNLEDFVPLARTMITMVYRNQFKDQFNVIYPCY